jgi:hypothetical protein
MSNPPPHALILACTSLNKQSACQAVTIPLSLPCSIIGASAGRRPRFPGSHPPRRPPVPQIEASRNAPTLSARIPASRSLRTQPRSQAINPMLDGSHRFGGLVDQHLFRIHGSSCRRRSSKPPRSLSSSRSSKPHRFNCSPCHTHDTAQSVLSHHSQPQNQPQVTPAPALASRPILSSVSLHPVARTFPVQTPGNVRQNTQCVSCAAHTSHCRPSRFLAFPPRPRHVGCPGLVAPDTDLSGRMGLAISLIGSSDQGRLSSSVYRRSTKTPLPSAPCCPLLTVPQYSL